MVQISHYINEAHAAVNHLGPYRVAKGVRANAIDLPLRAEQRYFVSQGGELMAEIVKLVQAILGAKEVTSTKVIRNVLDQIAFITSWAMRTYKHEWEKAVSSLWQAISLKPDFAESYRLLGDALSKLGGWGEARDAYQQVIRMQPNSVAAYLGLGAACTKLGQSKEAVIAY